MNGFPGDITWWSVGFAAFAYFFLGAVWFTPLFGSAWDRSIGHDRRATNGRFPISYYIVPLISAAISTVVIAVLLELTGTTGPVADAGIGALVGLAIAAATLTNALTPHTPKPYLFAAITGGYHLVGCIIVGLIIGAFYT